MGKLIKPSQEWGNIKEVEKLIKKAKKDAELVKRFQAIRSLMKGHSIIQISDILNCSQSSVKNWRDIWNTSGPVGLESNYQGRKSKYIEKVKVEIDRIFNDQQEHEEIIVSAKMIHDFIKKNSTTN